MSLVVVGSVAIDSIETPTGKREGLLGGACSYFSATASLYQPVAMVAVVGTDFPQEHVDFFASRKIDLSGLQRVPGRTFTWAARYAEDYGDAETLDTQLNVFADFHPTIPERLRGMPYLFLANINPGLQIEVLEQMNDPRLTALDSMNYWLLNERDLLEQAMSMVDVVTLNETEIKMYADNPNLLEAAQSILDLGPKALVVKRGEHGAMLITRGDSVGERFFVVPAYPQERVVDPTGAGDTFAAGFMGYLARTDDLSLGGLRRAVVHGSVVASFAVEDFSIDRLRGLSLDDIERRYAEFRLLTHFAPLCSEKQALLERPLDA